LFCKVTFCITFFLENSDEETLSDLVLFWTAYPTLPLDGHEMGVTCLDAIVEKSFPQAKTCPMILLLPAIHTSYEEFRNAMDRAISLGKCGFGNM
jgi:hypothetical protein